MSFEPRISRELPDFYEIPGFSRYIVSKEGYIYNRLLKKYSNKKQGSTSVSLVDDLGKTRGLTFKRLLNIALNGVPKGKTPFDKHIGRTSSVFDGDNIRWSPSKTRPTHIKCLLSGFRKTYEYIEDLCEDYNLVSSTLINRLGKENPLVVKNYLQIWQENHRNIKDREPFEYAKEKHSVNNPVVVIDDYTGVLTFYQTLRDCSELEGVPEHRLRYILVSGVQDEDDYRRFYFYCDLNIVTSLKHNV